MRGQANAVDTERFPAGRWLSEHRPVWVVPRREIYYTSREVSQVVERIVALLAQVRDEKVLERIYWYVERIVMRQPPKK